MYIHCETEIYAHTIRQTKKDYVSFTAKCHIGSFRGVKILDCVGFAIAFAS